MRAHQPRILFQFPFRIYPLTVVFIQVIIFDNCNQTISIRRIGSIACFFQSTRPAFIIGDVQFKKKSVTGTSSKEVGMIFVRVTRMLISTETFVTGIIIMTNRTSPPTATTLNTKVVITLSCQLAVSDTAFQQSLCQCNTRRNLMKLHLFNSQITILIYILDVTGIPFLCLPSYGKEKNNG